MAPHDAQQQLPPVFPISCGVQKYEWGIKADDGSLVAKYAQVQARGVEVKGKEPYAELWMGTHPSCPSHISTGSSDKHATLSSYLNSHPSLLGAGVLSHYGTGVLPASAFASSSSLQSPPEAPKDAKDGGALPFLFKVLSVGTALSIQAHPDKELGARLHKEKPEMYKDPNHKPEMAIAITDFSAFCGFRPLAQIRSFLMDVPEFRSVIDGDDSGARGIEEGLDKSKGSGSVEDGKKILRDLFARLMSAPKEKVGDAVQKLASRYAERLQERNNGNIEGSVTPALAQLVVTLNEQYPRDVGVLCTFVLSHLILSPGEALFLKANEPHAYLSGSIIECMAASDNVVRAGLTPKARDVDVLVKMLTYEHGEPKERMMQPEPFGEKQGSQCASLLYDPPIEEFSVVKTHLGQASPSRATQHAHRAIEGPSILIVTSGQGTIEYEGGKEDIEQAGRVFFIAAKTPITLKVSEGKEFVAFRAFVEVEDRSARSSAL